MINYRHPGVAPHLTDEEWERQCRKADAIETEQLLADIDDTPRIVSPCPNSARSSSTTTATGSPTAFARSVPSLTAVHSASKGGYSFPKPSDAQSITDSSKLVKKLRELASDITSHSAYDSVRQEWCALHLQANTVGLWAPAFRPWPKLPQRPREQCTDDDHAFQRDKLVIDAHWLHARNEVVIIDAMRAPMWGRLFELGAPFDFEIAEKFAQQVWSDDFRASVVLTLTAFQQSQMCAMRTKGHKEHMASFGKVTYDADRKRVQSPNEIVLRALAEWRERQPNLGDLRRLSARAEARYYLGPSASGAQIAKLAAMILAEPPQSGRTVVKSLEGLDKRLPIGSPLRFRSD